MRGATDEHLLEHALTVLLTLEEVDGNQELLLGPACSETWRHS